MQAGIKKTTLGFVYGIEHTERCSSSIISTVPDGQQQL
jgi:hypothetical protein